MCDFWVISDPTPYGGMVVCSGCCEIGDAVGSARDASRPDRHAGVSAPAGARRRRAAARAARVQPCCVEICM